MASYRGQSSYAHAERATLGGDSVPAQRQTGEGAWQTQLNAAPRVHAIASMGEALNRRVPNRTGLPDRLKTGLERMSGLPMDDVRVAYNSPRAAQMQGLAVTQGNQIHLGPGQEHHLAHEAWHVVQQKQGRVPAIARVGDTPLNDSPHLEREADQFGQIAARGGEGALVPVQRMAATMPMVPVAQRATGFLAGMKGLAVTAASAVPRLGKRLFNLGKHLTWDLGRAVYGQFNLPPAVRETSLIAQAVNPMQAERAFSELRFLHNDLTDLAMALHFMMHGGGVAAAVPAATYNSAYVQRLARAISAYLGQLNINLGPDVGGGAIGNLILATQEHATALNLAAPNHDPLNTVLNATAISQLVAPLQTSLSQVIDAVVLPAPGGLMQEEAPLLHWLAGLATKTVDVTGLKEILQSGANLFGPMTNSGVRDLTPREMNSAHEVFGDSQNLHDIQLLEKSHLPSSLVGGGNAFTVANTIHGSQTFDPDGDPVAASHRRGVLNHEILHVLQEQKQGMLSWIELQWGRRNSAERNPHAWDQMYDYGVIGANSQFRKFSREQQGAIVQDYSTFLEMHALAETAPEQADQIHGQNGHGQFQHYQAMLAGLKQGHWALPWQSRQWKQALG